MISVHDAKVLTREGFGRQDISDALSRVEECIKNNASLGLSSVTFFPKHKAEMYVIKNILEEMGYDVSFKTICNRWSGDREIECLDISWI